MKGWGWYGSIVEMAKDDFQTMKGILKENFYDVLLMYAYTNHRDIMRSRIKQNEE